VMWEWTSTGLAGAEGAPATTSKKPERAARMPYAGAPRRCGWMGLMRACSFNHDAVQRSSSAASVVLQASGGDSGAAPGTGGGSLS
jgi:hypothetical protein